MDTSQIITTAGLEQVKLRNSQTGTITTINAPVSILSHELYKQQFEAQQCAGSEVVGVTLRVDLVVPGSAASYLPYFAPTSKWLVDREGNNVTFTRRDGSCELRMQVEPAYDSVLAIRCELQHHSLAILGSGTRRLGTGALDDQVVCSLKLHVGHTLSTLIVTSRPSSEVQITTTSALLKKLLVDLDDYPERRDLLLQEAESAYAQGDISNGSINRLRRALRTVSGLYMAASVSAGYAIPVGAVEIVPAATIQVPVSQLRSTEASGWKLVSYYGSVGMRVKL